MKGVIMAGLVSLGAITVTAQPGLQIGYNVSNCRISDYSGLRDNISPVFTLNGGFLYRMPLKKWLLIEPALTYCRKGYRETQLMSFGFPPEYAQTRLDYVQVTVPLLLKRALNQDIDLTIGGGPFIAGLIHASQRLHYRDGRDEKFRFDIGNGKDDGYKRLDAGLHIAAGVRFGRANLSLSYDLGIVDISPLEDKILTRTFSLNIGLLLK